MYISNTANKIETFTQFEEKNLELQRNLIIVECEVSYLKCFKYMIYMAH